MIVRVSTICIAAIAAPSAPLDFLADSTSKRLGQISMRFMHFILLLVLLLGLYTRPLQAQTLSSPESVEYDAVRDRYLVSNRGNGEILAQSAGGTLSNFTTDPISPAGIEILGNTLFVADGARVRGYDLDSAQVVMTQDIAGASFLNGITSNGIDTLWVTDFSVRRLHQINVANLAAPVLSTPLTSTPNQPNGVIWDARNSRLLVLSWGTNAAIYQYSFSNANYSVLLATTSGNFDGIAFDCDGNLYFSSWTPSARIKFAAYPLSPSSTISDFVSTGLANPADITYNRLSHQIAVPNAGNSTLTQHAVASCSGVVFRDRFE